MHWLTMAGLIYIIPDEFVFIQTIYYQAIFYYYKYE